MRFSTHSVQRVRKNHTVMPSTNLSGGIARLLSPDMAAGIRRVKGAKRLGVRIGELVNG
jgi:hypothetical protein